MILDDLSHEEQMFKEAVAGLANYKRHNAHLYVSKLRKQITALQKELAGAEEKMVQSYEQGLRDGASRSTHPDTTGQ